ncbi:hypothetical protein SKAU_G00366390 [Synaphobranchus kaupii]|uniref:Uncharacterized protein n=1 Tax=Synaphobranchus kaupii TaxID=118154 RepID=A0A9Q1EF59_SYNKA|nr:hypothetical protein SKAU_G00366390 [Synaphobranchus kaupii]
MAVWPPYGPCILGVLSLDGGRVAVAAAAGRGESDDGGGGVIAVQGVEPSLAQRDAGRRAVWLTLALASSCTGRH